MAAGQAHGVNRDYQALCRNILISVNSQAHLEPYSGDGIDVRIPNLGSTDITFDIALRDKIGNIVVAECRRRREVVKQGSIFAFAYAVELLRKYSGSSVAGIFFTKSQYQIGAVKHADWAGIQVVICDDAQTVENFALSYQGYDACREKRLQKHIEHRTGSLRVKTSVSDIVRHKNDTASGHLYRDSDAR